MKYITVQGNKPLLVYNGSKSFIVKNGKVDIFLTKVKNGKYYGNRKYLFSSERVILGLNFSKIKEGYGLVLTGIPGTEVEEIPTDDLLRSFVDGKNLESLESYIESISNFALTERTVQRIETDRGIFIKNNMLFRPKNSIGWVELKEGSTNISKSIKGIYPLSLNSYDFTLEDSKIFIYETKDAVKLKDFSQNFIEFLNLLVGSYIINFENSNILSINKFRDKLKIAKQRMKEALGSLISVFFNDKASQLEKIEDDPYFGAAKAVCMFEEINIQMPKFKGEIYKKSPIEEIARVSKFMIRTIILTQDFYTKDIGSIFGYIRKGKLLSPVAILSKGANKYMVFDPTTGKSEILTRELAQKIHYEAYQFYRPFPNKKLGLIDIVKFGIRKKNLKDIATIGLMGFAMGLLGTLTPIFTGRIFNSIIPKAEYSGLLYVTVFLIAIAITTAAFQITRAIATLRFEGAVDLSIESAIWSRLLSLPVPFFKKYSSGDLSLRANSIIKIRQMLTGAAMSTILSAIFSIFQFFLLFYYSTKLAFVGLGLTLIPVVLVLISGMINIKVIRKLTDLQGKLTGLTFQIISGISKFRTTGGESRAFSLWAKDVAAQDELNYKSSITSNNISLLGGFYPVLTSFVLFYLYSKFSAGKSVMPVGNFLAFQAAFGSFMSSVISLTQIYISMLKIVPLYERAKPILESIPEVTEQKKDPGNLEGRIEINNISFRYSPEASLVLKNISLSINKGEYVAFVGASGSGKSTLLRLLLGFEESGEGNIFYDNYNVKDLDIQAIRRQLGVVLQNGNLMSGDIYSNIVGPHNLSVDIAWDAARAAGLDKDIETFPMGMHTMIPEGGGSISGGQKQRILIARALVNKPRVIYFDEATSALDNKTQSIVTESLDGLQATKIVVAHRLSTIIKADKIYVFDKGELVESGNYKELMAKNGLFAELAKRQIA